MKNKVELQKAIRNFIIVTLIGLVAFSALLFYQYKVYTRNYNEKIGGLIAKILEENADIKETELIEIINSNEKFDYDFLEKYGIDIQKDSVVLKNSNLFKDFMIVDILMLAGFSVLLLLIFLKYNRRKDKKLKEITRYIEEINKRNYKLDIEDNTEDELSILKNEIYKTTVMLKEVAENSKNDKINLKDSLSDISHQLKNPLTSVTIMLDNILDNPEMDGETRTEFIKDIKRQIINTNFLISSLLKLSKLDANSIDFINKEENLGDIIKQSVKNVGILCELRNIKIEISGDENIKINCDKKWQIEAITNILKNGIEHSKQDSKIDIKFNQNKIYSKIEIRDYGVGIEKSDIPHIFERFYKGKNASQDSVGIGLALSKSIIEKNNGDISVSSKLNEGTTFVIKYFI